MKALPNRPSQWGRTITKFLGESARESPSFLIPSRFTGVNDVTSALSGFLGNRNEEHLIVIHVSEHFENLQFTCHRGNKTSVDAPTKKIIADAVGLGTSGLILAHNHPSGDPTPSKADLMFTRRLVEVCQELDVSVLDHLIFGRDECVSLRRKGFL
jgi:DNA repair protein RadC